MSAQEIRQGRDGKNYSTRDLAYELRIMERLGCLNAKGKGILRAAAERLEMLKTRLDKLDRIEQDEAEKLERRRAFIEQNKAIAAALDDYDTHKHSGLLEED